MSSLGSLEWYLSVAGTIRDIYRSELLREPEPEGLYNWLFHAREEGKDGAWILAQVKSSPEWHAIHDKPQPIVRTVPPLPSGSYDKALLPTLSGRDYLRADSW